MTRAEGIHPTALVDPAARIHSTARIGAFSIVGAEVALGADAEVGHHVVLEGRVEIAPRAKVGHGSVLGGKPQDLKFRDGTPSGVRIGTDTVIREYVTIHRATHPDGWTEIGEGCLIMAMSHIAHDCRVGDGVILPGIHVTALVEAAGGARPTLVRGVYPADARHLEEYVAAAADDASFKRYLDRYVHG